MPENPNRVEVARRVEKAEKLLQKGKTAEALAEYLQILEGNPQNYNERQGRKEEGWPVLQRIVALEPSQHNHLRMAELSSELGEHAMASQSFLQLAEMAESSGATANPFFERAYSENPADSKIAVAYGKSLLTRGEAGAAIFIFEPLVHAGDASLDLRDQYAQALLAAGRCVESEPLIWQLFEQNPARMHQLVNLTGKMIHSELDAEAVALARKLEAFQLRHGERRSFITTMQELL